MARIHRLVLLTAVWLASTAAYADVTISAKPTSNMTCSGGVCSPTAKNAVLNVGDLAAMLSNGDAKITSGSLARDIGIDAKLGWAGNSRLTLDAYRSIAFNKLIDITGKGALTITTNDGGSGGEFSFFKQGRVKFWNLDSSLVINKQHYTLVKSVKQLGLDIRRDPHGYYALADSINLSKRVYTGAPIRNSFGGTFEGLGNTISNLTINDATFGENIGLFYQIFSATIRDVGLISVNIIGESTSQGVASFAGFNQSSTIANCYATGQLTSGGSSFAGGLIGVNQFGIVRNTFSKVVVVSTGSASVVGGLVAENDVGTVQESYATGAVSGGDGSMAGGLVGYNLSSVVSESYATGSVEGGSNAFVGGLVGSNENDPHDTAKSAIENSYSTGAVIGGGGSVLGGLIGEDLAQSHIKNSYWDIDTSGITNPAQGAGNIQNDPGITGLSDAQLKAGLPAGFDPSLWKEKANLNNGYPHLIANPPPK